MTKKEVMIVADYSQIEPLTLQDLCEICHVDSAIVNELISNDIIQPQNKFTDTWVFNLNELRRAKRALRLQHDLEINLSIVALVMDLLDEMDELRSRAELLEKHFTKE